MLKVCLQTTSAVIPLFDLRFSHSHSIMRFSTLLLAATAMTSVHALTPNQIISLLNNIEETTTSATALLKDAKASSQSSDAVPKMNVSSSNETDEGHNADRTEQAALEAVSHVATLYDDLNSELVSLATSPRVHFMYADKQSAIA